MDIKMSPMTPSWDSPTIQQGEGAQDQNSSNSGQQYSKFEKEAEKNQRRQEQRDSRGGAEQPGLTRKSSPESIPGGPFLKLSGQDFLNLKKRLQNKAHAKQNS